MKLKEFIKDKLEFLIYEPLTPNYNYECDNLDTHSFCKINYEDFLEEAYSGIEHEKIGVDQSGEYNIYNYKIRSKEEKYRICLSAGMHGIELGGILGLAWFVHNVLNSEERGFRWIRENVSIDFIPVLNPWGVSQQPLNYGNSNQVNINKNYKYHGVENILEPSFKESNGWSYSGDIDLPEEESKILEQWVEKYSLLGCNLYIDCHTAVQRESNDKYNNKDSQLLYSYASPGVIDKVQQSNDRILHYYNNIYNITRIGGVYPIDNSTIKNIKFFNIYNIPNLSIEQIVSYDELDWNGKNGCNAAVKNYVLMMREYIINILK